MVPSLCAACAPKAMASTCGDGRRAGVARHSNIVAHPWQRTRCARSCSSGRACAVGMAAGSERRDLSVHRSAGGFRRDHARNATHNHVHQAPVRRSMSGDAPSQSWTRQRRLPVPATCSLRRRQCSSDCGAATAASSPRRPRRSRSGHSPPGRGTTGTAGFATPHSRRSRCCASDSSIRRVRLRVHRQRRERARAGATGSRRRQSSPGGGRDLRARRIRRRASREDRQCGRVAGAARCPRRSDRARLRGSRGFAALPGRARRPRCRSLPGGSWSTGRARQRDLGDPRGAAALHAFPGHGG